MNSEEENYLGLLPEIEKKRATCVTILDQCKQWNDEKPIGGLHRFTNSVTSELNFLEKLIERPNLIKKEHVQSSNLGYLEAVFEVLEGVGNGRERVMTLFSVPVPSKIWKNRANLVRQGSVKVDIVAEHGLVWIKVIARNAKAFRHEMMGLEQEDSSDSEPSDQFESLPIFKKAQDYLKAAKVHHIQYQTPRVVFAFMRMEEEDEYVGMILNQLRAMGIVVHQTGGIRASYGDLEVQATTPVINLDVSSMLAILSELSHHVCLPEEVTAQPLQVQAAREAAVPALPDILQSIKGKRLYTTQTAYDRLLGIVEVVGGPSEQARFRYLFRHQLGLDLPFDQALWTILPSFSVEVWPDAVSEPYQKLLDPPETKSKLNKGKKIRSRYSELHAVIFGSGDHYRTTTLTAIQWMESALRESGILGVSVVAHEPRSLAEKKMIKKTTI